jgi:hypothetical protein
MGSSIRSFPLTAALLCCFLSLSLLPASFAATAYPGRCEVVKASHVQAVDSSSTCESAAEYAAAHPQDGYNPYEATAYYGSTGHVAGVTSEGAAACCQGHGSGCAGPCPCDSNILHCSGYTNGSSTHRRCIVSECEVPPQYKWIPDSPGGGVSGLLIVLLSVLLPAGLLLLAVLTWRWVKARRLRERQAGAAGQLQLLQNEVDAPNADSYVQLNR